jgi:hypothetical protein
MTLMRTALVADFSTAGNRRTLHAGGCPAARTGHGYRHGSGRLRPAPIAERPLCTWRSQSL